MNGVPHPLSPCDTPLPVHTGTATSTLVILLIMIISFEISSSASQPTRVDFAVTCSKHSSENGMLSNHRKDFDLRMKVRVGVIVKCTFAIVHFFR